MSRLVLGWWSDEETGWRCPSFRSAAHRAVPCCRSSCYGCRLVMAGSPARRRRRRCCYRRAFGEPLGGRVDLLAAERPQINGNEVMAHLGIGSGPQVGKDVKWLTNLRRLEGDLPHNELSRSLITGGQAKHPADSPSKASRQTDWPVEAQTIGSDSLPGTKHARGGTHTRAEQCSRECWPLSWSATTRRT